MKKGILLISVNDVKQILSIRYPLNGSDHKHKQSAHVHAIKLRHQRTMQFKSNIISEYESQ